MEFTADRKERLDVFLTRMLPEHSRTRAGKHIADGGVLVGGKAAKASLMLEPGTVVEVATLADPELQDLEPLDIPLTIAFEDEYLLVVDKPAGLSVHPSATSHDPTLVHALLAHSKNLSTASGDFRPGIVHRLDKETSGLLIVAKNDSVHRALQNAIQEKSVQRTYWAWVRGKPDQTEFTIRTFIGRNPRSRQKMAVVSQAAADAREAITHCKLLGSKDGASRMECRLETGRTHQIRVHLASVGLPVLGDGLYGVTWPGLDRQALHAVRLKFVHPVTDEVLDLEAGMPDDVGRIGV